MILSPMALDTSKHLARFAILLGLIAPLGMVAAGQDGPKEEPIVKLEFANTKAETKIVGGSELNCQVRITGRPGAKIPKNYLFTFEGTWEGKMTLAGQFIGETKHDRDNLSFCTGKLKAPRRAGEYTLRVTTLPVLPQDKTPEDKIEASIKVQVVE